MFGSTTLEVAIGIVFVYLLLSLICSALNEWIARGLAMRSNTLEDGLRNLLNDPEGEGLTKQLYQHPLIKTLARQGWFDRLVGRHSKPSYIPSSIFALALLDLVMSAGGASAADGPRTFAELREAVAKLPDNELRGALLPLIDKAEGNIQKARENVEEWFNSAMDRVSGWYKRKVQLILLILALGTSAFLNADTIMIANSLSRDVTMRAAIVASAQEMVRQTLPADVEQPPLTWIEQLQAEFQRLQLPIGWSSIPGDPREVPRTPTDWVMKIAGLLITTLAVSLGAPFWFDVLNKLVNLRSEGKRPEEAGAG